MALECYCDYESPDVYSSRLVCARKPYRCDECDGPIFIGERYEYAFGVQDGYPYQPHTCLDCVGIRKFIQANIPCWCWAHGNMLEDARKIIEAAYSEARDEVKGLAFGFGRLLVKARRNRRAREIEARRAKRISARA